MFFAASLNNATVLGYYPQLSICIAMYSTCLVDEPVLTTHCTVQRHN